jgi:hypothetical protein
MIDDTSIGYKSPMELEEFENNIKLKKILKDMIEEQIEEKRGEEKELAEKEEKKKNKRQKQKNKVRNRKGGATNQPQEAKELKTPSPATLRKREQRAREKAARGIEKESKLGRPFKLSEEQEDCLIKKLKDDLDHNVLHPLKWLCERVCNPYFLRVSYFLNRL